ncbi:MAG TPA: hypothetical protein VHX62_01900 [Solirubrobacteraceae bacterium]|nr:hypothetical protein [Solirubrobacteraceae bacterium]
MSGPDEADGPETVLTVTGERRWRQDVRWATVAARHGRPRPAGARWPGVAGAADGGGRPGLWDQAPDPGSLPRRQAALLAGILSRFTATPESCAFAIWPSLAAGGQPDRDESQLTLHDGRRMMLVMGAVGMAAASFSATDVHQSANLWWPRDREWRVATDLGQRSTLIGGSEACILAVLTDARLESVDLTGAVPGAARRIALRPLMDRAAPPAP